jgi:hypothetical protein
VGVTPTGKKTIEQEQCTRRHLAGLVILVLGLSLGLAPRKRLFSNTTKLSSGALTNAERFPTQCLPARLSVTRLRVPDYRRQGTDGFIYYRNGALALLAPFCCPYYRHVTSCESTTTRHRNPYYLLDRDVLSLLLRPRLLFRILSYLDKPGRCSLILSKG